MISAVLDLIHIILAGALSLIGVAYAPAPDCEPVRFHPAAHVETVDAESLQPASFTLPDAGRFVIPHGSNGAPVSDCEERGAEPARFTVILEA